MDRLSGIETLWFGLASPEEILSGSSGEVTEPETVDFRTLAPVPGGLFCERIFGRIGGWACPCPKRDAAALWVIREDNQKGIVCPVCGVESPRDQLYGQRMGHIRLAAPVCHTWWRQGDPSPLSLLVDVKPRLLEEVLRYESHLVTFVDRRRLSEASEALRSSGSHWLRVDGPAEPEADAATEGSSAPRRPRSLKTSAAAQLLSGLVSGQVLQPSEWSQIRQLLRLAGERLGTNPSAWVRAGMGAEPVRERLAGIDWEQLERELTQQIAAVNEPIRSLLRHRLKAVAAMTQSRSQPERLFLEVLPVLPPENRPMVQRSGTRWASSDLNELYRRVISRNNRLKTIIALGAPVAVISRERGCLQEAVDALFDNARQPCPVLKARKAALGSLSDSLSAELRPGGRGRGKALPRSLKQENDMALVSMPRYHELMLNYFLPTPPTVRKLCAICHRARALGLSVGVVNSELFGARKMVSFEELLDAGSDTGAMDWDDLDPDLPDLD